LFIEPGAGPLHALLAASAAASFVDALVAPSSTASLPRTEEGDARTVSFAHPAVSSRPIAKEIWLVILESRFWFPCSPSMNDCKDMVSAPVLRKFDRTEASMRAGARSPDLFRLRAIETQQRLCHASRSGIRRLHFVESAEVPRTHPPRLGRKR
jgi:hypothetical protein